MRVEKYIQKYSTPNQKIGLVDTKGNQIANNHEYLNFVKKNAKLIELEKNKLMYPSAIEITRNNSIFIAKDKQYYRTEKLTMSVNAQKEGEHVMSAKKIYDIIEKKNQEIQESIVKERQSMSDIVYNYSKFRSMEQNYYKSERNNQRSKKKEVKVDRVRAKDIDGIKFPLIPKNNQEVFTIEYDGEGRKVVKVNLAQISQSPDKKKSQSLINEKAQGEGETKRELKHDLNFFKRRKNENQFGIEIKSINRVYENEIRKQSYQLDSSDKARKSLLESKKKQPIQGEEIQQEIEEGPQDMRKPFYSSQSFHFSTGESLSMNLPTKRPKFSVLTIQREDNASIIDEQLQVDAVQPQSCEIIYFKQKQKSSQPVIKREKKSIMLINSDKEMTIYDQKMNSYRQFLFMINFAHFRFDPLVLKETAAFKNEDKYRYYIGKGNNSLLVQSIFKRRFWWNQEEDYKKANLAWTQLKIISFFEMERKTEGQGNDCKLDSLVKVEKKKKIAKNASQIKSKGGFKPPLPAEKDKIFTTVDKYNYQLYESSVTNEMVEKMNKYSNRLKYFQPNYLQPCKEDKSQEKMHNHLEYNHFIGNKKALYYNLKRYYELRKKNVFQIIPLTFHIKEGASDPDYIKFTKQYKKIQSEKYRKKKVEDEEGKKKLRNIWIVKPGELSNRGNGIVVIDEIYQLNNIFKKKEKHQDGNDKTYIVQKYIQNPLLYKGRKFDIRHYMLITRLHGIMRAYWFGEGYIRTSSYDFDLDDIGDEMIHLTNDAIQKNCTFYGKHEEGNKLSYFQFQKYLDQKYGEGKCSFSQHIYPKMKAIATDAVKSTYLQLDSHNLQHNFEIFGLDFMIDENFDVWLIEVNTNPCLEISSKLLGRIIPNMLEHAFRLSIDVIFPPPCQYPNSQKYLAPDNPLGRLNYELIFDQARDSKELIELFKDSKEIDYGGQINEDNEVYENEGKELQLSPDLN